MARRSSRSSVSSRAAPRPARVAAVSKTAPVRASTPMKPQSKPSAVSNPITQSQGPSGGGLLSTVASGMAFGTGSAIAHRAVDAVMGGGSSGHQPAEENSAPGSSAPQSFSFDNEGSSNPCTADLKAFQDCLSSSGNSLSRCKYYFDMLQQCQLRAPQQAAFSYGDD